MVDTFKSNLASHAGDDMLWRHLKTVPAFRALLRSVEAQYFQEMILERPILDLGCGDGHFASMAFVETLTVGIDPWWRPLQKARRSGAYDGVIEGLGHVMPFPSDFFSTVISNSVLEHIPDVQPVLDEAARILKPSGQLVITMPGSEFTRRLGMATWLERHGLTRMADGYRRFFNRIARHAHTDPPEVWADRLSAAGLVVEKWQYYFSEQALHALELGHLIGIPSWVLHLLTRRWIVAPWRSSLYFTERWLRPYVNEPAPEVGTMLFFVARKPPKDDLGQ